MGKVVNMNGKEVNAVTINKARQYFPGRKGNEFMTYKSFKEKIRKGGIPKTAYTKVNKVYWIDENYLMGMDKNTAA